MEEAIAKLGGRMTTSFDPLAFHLITGSVAETEKVLLSTVSGLWLLHPSFMTESLSQGRWQREEKFEWGNDWHNSFLKKGQELARKEKENTVVVQLAEAAELCSSEVTHIFTVPAYIRKESVDFGFARRGIPVLNYFFLYNLLTSNER